jgi:foldase protein PrsA
MKRSVFVAVLALAFAATARAENDREVIKVNGTPIRQSEIVERLWKRFGPSMLDEMVDEVLLRQNARKLDVKAEPAEIDKRLARIRAQFPDSDSFNAQLKRSGATLESFKKDLAEQIVQEKIIIKKDKISVKDEELKTAFQERKERLGAPERIHLLHMVVDPKEVPAVLAKLKAGADFKAQAKDKSLAPTGKINGGDYGFVARGMLPPEIEEIAFGLKSRKSRRWRASAASTSSRSSSASRPCRRSSPRSRTSCGRSCWPRRSRRPCPLTCRSCAAAPTSSLKARDR